MRALPSSVEGVIADLEANYPPRCKSPDESLEAHMMYAGQVDLIAVLRSRFEWTRQNYRMDNILKEI